MVWSGGRVWVREPMLTGCVCYTSAMSADVMMSHVAKGKYVVKAEQRLCTLVEIILYNV